MSAPFLVIIPTYNEKDNAENLYTKINALNLGNDYLFIDDNSPDGTGQILDNIAAANSKVFVLHRTGKLGIGTAHLEGIRWAYDHNYGTIVTMDCDFTHQPEDIIKFLHHSKQADVVVGSRYLDKESLGDWSFLRRGLSHFSHSLTKTFLALPYDATNAFRVYNLQNIPKNYFDLVQSKSYSFFFESLFILHVNNIRISEIPTRLPKRVGGESKMTFNDAWSSAKRLFITWWTFTRNKNKLILRTAS